MSSSSSPSSGPSLSGKKRKVPSFEGGNGKGGNGSENVSNLKQGNLFSFFSKKKDKKPLDVKSRTSASSPPLDSSSMTLTSTNDSKATTATCTSTPVTTASTISTASNNIKKNTNKNHLWKQVQVGDKIRVFWPEDKQYYAAKVVQQRQQQHQKDISTFSLRYDDGETEWTDLSQEKFQFISRTKKNTTTTTTTSASGTTTTTNKTDHVATITTRRHRIVDDDEDDEEFELDDAVADDEDDNDDDDDGSVFVANDRESEDENEEEEQEWMVSDDDDEEQDVATRSSSRSQNKKSKINSDNKGRNGPAITTSSKQIHVTRHEPGTTMTTKMTPRRESNGTSTFQPSVSQSSSSSFKTPLRQFANTVSPSTTSTDLSQRYPSSASSSTTNNNISIRKKTIAGSTKPASPSSLPLSASKVTSSPPQHQSLGNKSFKALPFVKGAINVQGAHVHNHLAFLQDPKDSQGNRPSDPNYNPRTLQVNYQDWDTIMGAKMTHAVQQWWDLKSQYFDTVLLFKTGKFYEMFHMDADVGVQTLGLIYMKGHVAHAGFPEISYGPMADKLVQAGYKVARVEQTETPEQLKHRKTKMTKGQKKPSVVNREVCSIVSLGTRTFCALDDEAVLKQLDSTTSGNGASGNGGGGPLLAISETLLEGNIDTSKNTDDIQPAICEYGITLVDAIRGTVTLGQFADDVLRSRMNTLLARMTPSEILLQDSASPTLSGLVKSFQRSATTPCRVEIIQSQETFPKSTALELQHRQMLERPTPVIHPWNVQETLDELHRRAYYPRGSKTSIQSIQRWPPVLQAMIEGKAHLGLASLGAALFYLQRHLIDQEILSMGLVKAYIPEASVQVQGTINNFQNDTMQQQEQQEEDSNMQEETENPLDAEAEPAPFVHLPETISTGEDQISYLSLDGTTLHNLEILTNAVDHKVSGSLWSKLNYCKSPHGARFLRAWLLRPLFRKADIDRRADAVQELASGAGAVALHEARQHVLGKIGDLDRLLSRIHSMSGSAAGTSTSNDNADNPAPDGSYHPNERAVLYENATYTKRKVNDFSKALKGLKTACQIPELFADLNLDPNGLLHKLVKVQETNGGGAGGGCFPQITEELDWFFDNFNCDKAAKGLYEPTRGVDEAYDQACDTIVRIQADLDDYRQEMCSQVLKPKHVAQRSWKYVNTKPESKDKYLIELPATVQVPDDFLVKGKRGSGPKQINKYRTPVVARWVAELEEAIEIQQLRKAKGMQLIFAKFDAKRSFWRAAAQATAMLDALGSLAKVASKPGFCRPTILDCPIDQEPVIDVVQGRHPCVEGSSIHATEFIPNDLRLGGTPTNQDQDAARLLLLSGPNMGGKSTLLRQTCLIAILAQMGSYVPAEACSLTPVDCIYTRLGASDRILLGQSTFFVELAETAAALRGATRRSLVIMDELGRGTSTFDGTAIAGATVKHLISRSQCLSLFATHYHSLLDEWKNESKVRLGHMQCLVEDSTEENTDHSITFLYTLGPGTCPKSFGINVARLASLPGEVLDNAKRVSQEFEEEMAAVHQNSGDKVSTRKAKITTAIEKGNWDEVERLWEELNNDSEN